MRKGIFIPDITVEMFRNASLEVVEELLVSGSMEDIEIPERPHGKWIFKHNSAYIWCSNCDEDFDAMPQMFLFCPNCGADMREEE